MTFYGRPNFKDNDSLIDYLHKEKTIKTAAVIEAMKKVDRKDFVPGKAARNAYEDCPQYIGFGATISAPHMHGHALEQLSSCLKPGMKALDVGSGSGILAAYMCHMVAPVTNDKNDKSDKSDKNDKNGDSKQNDDNKNNNSNADSKNDKKGKVIGIEHMGELVTYSLKNLNKNVQHSEWLKDGTLLIFEGDGRKGYLKEAPYDCIHVGAAAPEKCVQTLFEQLKDYGLMAIPVELEKTKEQIFRLYTKDPKKKDKITQKILAKDCYKDLLGVRYVPLTDHDTQAKNAY